MTTIMYNWYTYNRHRHREKLRKLWENWYSSYITQCFDNYQTTLFIISSNFLFSGNSDKNYGDKDVCELILVWIFDFQSMPSLSWGHVIKEIMIGLILSVQELNIFQTSMLWMMLTIFMIKLEHQFLFDVDTKRKKDPNMASIMVPANMRFLGWYDI